MEIRSKGKLINYVSHGNKAKYLFFWGYQMPMSGVSKTCFFQWYEASLELGGTQYRTAEHYMMAEKTRGREPFGICFNGGAIQVGRD
jgi:predicted NAD-dependent protein-ADP-ribosyltransferase YbiA (DUF1768 family)